MCDIKNGVEMNFILPAKLLKIKILVIVVLLSAVVVSAVEPTREFIVETVIEQQYHELETFKRMVLSLDYKILKEKDLLYINSVLDELLKKNRFFILKDDVLLLKARVYSRLGETIKSRGILENLLKSGGDSLSKIDAALELALIYEKKGLEQKAIPMLESARNLNPYYKKDQICLTLARYYYLARDFKNSGQYIIQVSNLEKEVQPFFQKIVKLNWDHFSREDKKSVLSSFSRMEMYDAGADYAKKYIFEENPSLEEIEKIALDLVYHSRSLSVRQFIDDLGKDERYSTVYGEMVDLYNLNGTGIRSHSGSVRGSYYYSLLKPLNRKSRYDDQKALTSYQKYISGDVDIEYVHKNLQMTIRNLLAFRKYADITNVVAQSYEALRLDPLTEVIGDDISFWNGYALNMLGDDSGAVRSLEEAISDIPDGYFAMQSCELIRQIHQKSNVSEAEYIHDLEKRIRNSPDNRQKLFISRILYPFKKGIEKEDLRDRIVALAKKFNDHAFFDFDDSIINKLKRQGSYIRFIAHTRFGLMERAKAILSAADISDPTVQNLLILRELSKNRDFKKADNLYGDLASDEFLNKNFAFLSRDIQMLFYPLPYESEVNTALSKINNEGVDKYLVYSVIRIESMYIPTICSRTGAKGLMQIMPETARLISQKTLQKREVNLYNPLNNIILGTVFLNDSIQSYGLLQAVASYNGGMTVLKKTSKKFSTTNDVELMEILPYLETREYVKKIFTSYNRYQSIYLKDDWKALSTWNKKKYS